MKRIYLAALMCFVLAGQALSAREGTYSMRETSFTSNGMKVYAQAFIPDGSGTFPTVVMAHGYNGGRAVFNSLVSTLAPQGYLCVTIDFCGGSNHDNRSDGSPLGMSVFTERQNLLDVVDQLRKWDNVDKDNLFLVGESQGGLVSAMTAAEIPDKVRAIALAYPAFSIPEGAKQMYSSVDDIPEKMNVLGMEIGRTYYKDLLEYDVYSDISRYKGDVLIVHGSADGLVDPECSARASSRYRNCELHLIAGANHGWRTEEENRAFNDYVSAFLAKENSSSRTFTVDLPAPASDTEERVMTDADGAVTGYSNVTRPSITVMLPDPSIATGTAVLINPGGALMFLSWESEFKRVAKFFTDRGIAAIGVKYRTKVMGTGQRSGQFAAPVPQIGPSLASGRLKIQDFAVIEKANANPSPGDEEDIRIAAEDFNNAMRTVKENAGRWGIAPWRIGTIGFSAGGGVELAGLVQGDESTRPAFIGSLYGPSLVDLNPGPDAPKLFIAVHADHPNVAAGCLALFLEWKKAGVDAELHIYGEGTGGLYSGSQTEADRNTDNGSWLEAFYSWLVAGGFTS